MSEWTREFYLSDIMHPCGKCHHAGDCFCYENNEPDDEIEEDMFCWIMLPVDCTWYQNESPYIWKNVVEEDNYMRMLCRLGYDGLGPLLLG